MIKINVNVTCLLDNSAGFLHLRQRLQAKEVHLDESRRLDDMAVILCAVGLLVLEVGVVSRADRHPVTDGIAADDEATGMNTRTTHRTLQHLGILDGVCQSRIGRSFGLLQLRHSLEGIDQIHLRCLTIYVGQTVGNGLTQTVRLSNGHLLHACHVLDGVLCSHRGIGDDMCTILVTILVLDPLQHTTAAVVVEVSINIGQRDTVGIEETLEQQVVLQWVNLGDSQAVSHYRACRRATSRTNHHAQLVASRVDKVLHYQEVARETHRLHNVQFEANAVVDLL